MSGRDDGPYVVRVWISMRGYNGPAKWAEVDLERHRDLQEKDRQKRYGGERRRRRSPRRRASAVIVRQVDPRVMRYALMATGGDPSRIQIHPDGSVTILNRSRRRPLKDA